MTTVFRGRKGVLMVEFVQQGTTITLEVHCETQKKKPVRVIHNKRCGMLTYSAVLLHDNARPHTAVRTRALLEPFNWELFYYHSYSPDLASSDYHLFTYPKNWLGSQRFENNELMEGIKTWLSSQAADFFDTDTKKLIPRYERCLSSGGDYTEK
jgi:histone-lysine N-methyltransferase SETMAR